MNTLLSRTLQDEPINEKIIRGLQDLNAAHERMMKVTMQMIASGHEYCDLVDRIMEGD